MTSEWIPVPPEERTVSDTPATVRRPATTTISFYGASDDLVEVRGCDGADEFNTYETGPLMWSGEVIAPGAVIGLRVYAIYDRNGTWSFAVAKLDEDVPLPDWPIRVRQSPDCEYSTALEIDAPVGSRLITTGPLPPR